MICYRDMTLCSGDGCAKFDTCHRALTPEVARRAYATGLPIAQWETPQSIECYESPGELTPTNKNQNTDT